MKRSKFNLSNYKLLSCDMGNIVPIGLTEVLPGDTFQMSTSLLIRCSPLLAPVMHPVHAKVHHWFVPHRLVWDNWENFITGGPDGMDDSAFPYITQNYAAGPPPTGSGIIGGLGDYLGVTPQIDGLQASALPFRGYNLIFNEWYRDQDLVSERAISKGDGSDTTTTRTFLATAAWEKDYFTSARPWTQKGPEITIPLTGDAVITGAGTNLPQFQTQLGQPSGPLAVNAGQVGTGVTPNGNLFWADPALEADLSSVSAANINDLRLAFALQRYEEARARYGSRYTEYLRYLGVRSSDARLQRPEYLGGGKQTIQFSEVLQTTPDEGGTTVGVGEMFGHGIGALRSNRFRRFFEEHGYIFTLLIVRPRTIYAQGLFRHWNRRTKEDFWQRELQHIGQQEVLNKEVYAASPDPNGVFGYQDRYDEYRRQESSVSGEFRTSELDFWHFARIFSAPPALNSSFVTSVPTKRTFAVQTDPVLWIMANHHVVARRMVAKTGNSYIY